MIGSSLAAIISVGTGTMATSIGVGGIPGILSIFPQYMPYFALAMGAAIIVPFVLTYLIGSRKLSAEERGIMEEPVADIVPNAASVAQSFGCPLSGKAMKLSEVEDQVFSQGMMGDGFAVELSDGNVVAPFDGEVVMTFPTGHAYGLRNSEGIEVLIHIGMDTVEMHGDGFVSLVKAGDIVKKGDIIAKVDLAKVKQANKSLVSPVVFTSQQKVELLKEGDVKANEEIIEIRG